MTKATLKTQITSATRSADTIHSKLSALAIEAMAVDYAAAIGSADQSCKMLTHFLQSVNSRKNLTQHSKKFVKWVKEFAPVRVNTKAAGGGCVVGIQSDKDGIDYTDGGQWRIDAASVDGFWLYDANKDEVEVGKQMIELVKTHFKGIAKAYAMGTVSSSELEAGSLYCAGAGLDAESMTAILDKAIKEYATLSGNTAMPVSEQVELENAA